MKTVCFVFLLSSGSLVFPAGLLAQQPVGKARSEEPLDPLKRVERIIQNAETAGQQLEKKDPGQTTQELQQQILKDIDALLNQPPPPNPMGGGGGGGGSSSSSSSSGGGGSSSSGNSGGSGGGQSSGGGSSAGGPRPQGNNPQAQGGQPQGTGSPTAKPGQPGSGPMGANSQQQPMGTGDGQLGTPMAKPSRGNGSGDKKSKKPMDVPPEQLSEMSRGIWGHLPAQLRQELDHYYRDQFMPRYSDLLRQYYASIAEASQPRE